MEGNMPSKSKVRSVLVYLGLGVSALGLAVSAQAAKKSSPPSIDGTYRFLYRELPDGTKQMPPDVVGVNDFHHGVRNFNIYWHDAQGKRFSISYVANYKFDGKEYSEKSLYMMSDDEIDGKGISYDLTGPSGMSKVTVKGAR